MEGLIFLASLAATILFAAYVFYPITSAPTFGHDLTPKAVPLAMRVRVG
jgi:hypothetical protein